MIMFIWCALPSKVGSKERTAVDQLGRQVTLPEYPRRIVAFAPSITEIIFALGEGHRLKGVTLFSDFPPEAEKIPRVGSYVNLDLERIVSLKPDLCIATKDGNPKEIVERLDNLKIPVYAVDPRSLESVMVTVLRIGTILSVPEKAASVVQDMRGRIESVRSLVSTTHSRPRVFFQIGTSPIVSVGTHTFAHELIELAGGKNLAAGDIAYPGYSREQVLALAPEVIVISTMTRGEAFSEIKAEWGRWSLLPAVRDNRIFLVDSNIFDRPSPRMVDALELLVKIIHPELFSTKNMGKLP